MTLCTCDSPANFAAATRSLGDPSTGVSFDTIQAPTQAFGHSASDALTAIRRVAGLLDDAITIETRDGAV